MIRKRAMLLLIGLLLAGCSKTPTTSPSKKARIAESNIVDIVGRDADGMKIDLKDYRGKVVLLDFWRTN